MATFLQQKPDEFVPYVPKIDLEGYLAIATQRQKQKEQNLAIAQQQYDIAMGYDNPMAQIQLEASRGRKGKTEELSNFQTPSGGGIKVSREVDKQRLSQLQKELFNEVQQLVKSDFSSQKVFNRAEGLTRRVTHDAQIRNAVASTQAMQAQNAHFQELQDKHPERVSVENTHMMQKQQQAYLNSQDPNASYTQTTYTPYYNVYENFAKHMKDVKGFTYIEQTPIDSGDPYSSGLRAFALNEHGIQEEVSPERVRKIFQTWLQTNPDAQRQIDISSEYYADTTPDEHAIEMNTAFYTQLLKNTNESIDLYNTMLLSTDSISEKEEIERLIGEMEAYKKSKEAEFKDTTQQILENPHLAKKEIYQNIMANNVEERYARRSEYTKQKANIYGDRLRKAENEEYKRQLAEIEAQQKKMEEEDDGGLIVPVGVPKEQFENSYNNFVDGINNTAVYLENTKNKMVYDRLMGEGQDKKAEELFSFVDEKYDDEGNLIAPAGLVPISGKEDEIDKIFAGIQEGIETNKITDLATRQEMAEYRNRELVQKKKTEIAHKTTKKVFTDGGIDKRYVTPESLGIEGGDLELYTTLEAYSELIKNGEVSKETMDKAIKDIKTPTFTAFSKKIDKFLLGEPSDEKAKEWLEQSFKRLKEYSETDPSFNKRVENIVSNNFRSNIENRKQKKNLSKELAKYTQVEEDLAYVIPLNNKNNAWIVSELQTHIAFLSNKKTRGDYGKWNKAMNAGVFSSGSGSSANIQIVDRGLGNYFVQATGEGTKDLKEIPIGEREARRWAPELFAEDVFSTERHALKYNRGKMGESYLVKPGKQNGVPNGFSLRPTEDLRTPVRYNVISNKTSTGGNKYKVQIYYKPNNQGWKEFDFGENFDNWDDFNQVMSFIYSIDDEALTGQ